MLRLSGGKTMAENTQPCVIHTLRQISRFIIDQFCTLILSSKYEICSVNSSLL